MKARTITVHELKILRGTGRGTIRRMVEGSHSLAAATEGPLHHAASRRGSPPRSGEDLNETTLSATVSKGTYIRSLARDIALALNSVGHVTMLRRTRAGPFSLESAISLDFLEEAAKARRLTETVLPLTAALDDIPALPVTPDQARLLRHGQMLFGVPAKPGLGLATLEGTPIALVEATADGLRVVRGFNL
jgi:tRNA pseudouridine55 synthase